jgi:hypothetical protein
MIDAMRGLLVIDRPPSDADRKGGQAMAETDQGPRDPMDPSPRMSRAGLSDTHPAVEALLIEGYRQMSPAQKLERVRALTRAVQELALVDIRRRHPDADEREQALRLASRWIEPELMLRAFGWDVRKEGY